MQYFFSSLKEICGSNVSSKFDDGWVLESKFGKVNFTLPEVKSESIDIFFKRISGNGKILINNVQYVISSKKSECKTITLNGPTVSITRPSDSTGEVAIFGIEVHLKKEEDVRNHWKSIFSKFNNYKGLALVKDTLHASENAFIEPANLISNIETDPPEVAVRVENKLCFKHSCKIVSINIDDTIKIPKAFDIIERQPPNPLVERVSDNGFSSVNYMPPQVHTSFSDGSSLDLSMSNKAFNVVYDSDLVKGLNPNNFNQKNKSLKFINSRGKHYICMKPGGDISIPLSGILPNKKFIFLINGKRVSGNGKFKISLNEGKSSTLLFTNSFENKFIFLSSDSSVEGTVPVLKVKMEDDGVGDILISRVLVVEYREDDKNLAFAQISNEPIESISEQVISDIPSFATSFNSFRYKMDSYLSNTKKFVIVIPSYKNEEWAEKNIISSLNQNYPYFRIMFTDDCSPDSTFEIVSRAVESHPNKSRVTLVKNSERKGALENLYNMIHSCDDDEIILTLDGDDWFPDDEVLNKLSKHYNDDIWMTYGQYQNFPDGGRGIAQRIPDNIIQASAFRRYTWCSSHLRTFYAWLFKQIKKEDFLYEGKFMAMTWDSAMMFPMLEMSGHRSRYIPDTLYIYNLSNPINDHKVNQRLQQSLDRLVRSKPKYALLEKEPEEVLQKRNVKIKVGLLIIATGKYDEFIPNLIESANKYYFNDEKFEVTYFVFTDKQVTLNTERNYKIIPIEHRSFPFASMDRFKHFTKNAEILSEMDFLHYVDVDTKFVDNVSYETLGDLVGVRHCGFFNGGGTFEKNTQSVFYTNPSQYKYYFGGGFSGGKTSSYLKLSKWCYEMIETDLSNSIIPTWHDETAINKYFLDNEPDVILSPSYHYPENDRLYLHKWKPHKFTPKILLLEKKHKEVR